MTSQTTTTTTTRTTKAVVDDRIQLVLEVLAAAPDLSQRELAGRTGLSLTKAHFVLRELIERGLVQMRSSGRSSHRLGYVYLLTPEGHELQTRLAYAAMQSTVVQFRQILRGFRAALSDLAGSGVTEIGMLGDGPLCEAVLELIERDGRLEVVELERAGVVVVCDPAAEADYAGSARLVRLAPRVASGAAHD